MVTYCCHVIFHYLINQLVQQPQSLWFVTFKNNAMPPQTSHLGVAAAQQVEEVIH